MTAESALPTRRPDLVVAPGQQRGKYVVKNPATGRYFQLGEEERFLLERLDGRLASRGICAAFERRFGSPLSDDELLEFLNIADARGLLTRPGDAATRDAASDKSTRLLKSGPARDAKGEESGQSLLYWRMKIVDPDRFLTRLQPRLSFFWTTGFVVVSLITIIFASITTWANRGQLVSYFPQILRWESVLAVWITLFAVTLCHELAHGLTCKRFGGAVHEIGFLLIFLMPGFYCNVSDAWLFREKWKRIWVTLSGGYFELFLWAGAVFVWRLSLQSSLINYLAWIMLTVTGARVFFNFNPLLKLDGYYLLSDGVGIPNLRQKSVRRFAGTARSVLWGGEGPAPSPRSKFLFVFGAMSWLFSLIALTAVLFAIGRLLVWWFGPLASVVPVILWFSLTWGFVKQLFGGEFQQMFSLRRSRSAAWLVACLGLLAVTYFLEIREWSGGPFQIRSMSRTELRAPVAGFLTDVYFEEGDLVSEGAAVAQLEIPDLESRLVQGRCAIRESEARLQQLQVGTRPSEIEQQIARVDRACLWKELGADQLARSRKAHAITLIQLEEQIRRYEAELRFAREAHARAESLLPTHGVSAEEYSEKTRDVAVAQARLEQARANTRLQEQLGVLEEEQELARRQAQLAEEEEKLALMQAGSRPEEIAAQEARLARLHEELHYLSEMKNRLIVACPTSGTVITRRVRDQIGRYLAEGELVCEVADFSALEVEVQVGEQQAARIRIGDPVSLKARALPFKSFSTCVNRITPVGEKGSVQSVFTVSCKLPQDATLRPGHGGYARIYHQRRPIYRIVAEHALGFLRTEFWW